MSEIEHAKAVHAAWRRLAQSEPLLIDNLAVLLGAQDQTVRDGPNGLAETYAAARLHDVWKHVCHMIETPPEDIEYIDEEDPYAV